MYNSRQEDINTFLKALAPGEVEFTVQLFPDREDATVVPYHVHGTMEDLQSELETVNNAGGGVFFMVNKGDGKGRKNTNVVAVRAIFIDLDGAPLPAEWPLQPHVVVESSPGRYHVYWRVVDCPLEQFGPVQSALAEMYQGDTSVHDLARVMRLPNFWHKKGDPFVAA